MGTRACTTGETGKVQGRDRVGIAEGSCVYRARGVSIRVKFVLSRNLGDAPISLEVRLLTILASHSHEILDSGPRWLPTVTSCQIVDHGGSPLSLDLSESWRLSTVS